MYCCNADKAPAAVEILFFKNKKNSINSPLPYVGDDDLHTGLSARFGYSAQYCRSRL
jgi:hypothetical protein